MVKRRRSCPGRASLRLRGGEAGRWWQNRHTGQHGTEIALPPVTFTHEFLANRVDGNSDDILPLHKPRLYTITSETGAQSVVNYLPADCTAGQAKPAVDTNTKRCYPVYWSPNGEKTPILVVPPYRGKDRGERHALPHNAGGFFGLPVTQTGPRVPEALRVLIDRQPSPSFLCDRFWNVLAYNPVMANWWPWVTKPGPNPLTRLLLDPEARHQYLDLREHADR
ncbi:hypothetical protein GCM10011583_60430 [Streptomyces camponoticapitis]|uniref:MmyB-like transcription regulator ligand binding domain-containing protein n=1 Tax=Streptomyces camponoticapitis TaxID=1616125 RepID=A0ABQ2EQ63_9ACTN|nr:hypothetical protein [Streptomyces camponoticapitis]GGK20465.1 hypothetical protein GCM10011583_60430 [Streptomyces camponoticapitis]